MRFLLIGFLLIVFFPTVPAAAAPPFRIVDDHGAKWLATPNGQRFFSLGVCCVDRGVERKDYRASNPSYAAWRWYRDAQAWADSVIGRLQAWHFTTVGAWSDIAALRKARRFDLPFTVIVPLGMSVNAPWDDMWDPARVQRMDRIARDAIVSVRDDPLLIGYYTDNEQGWWTVGLLQSTLKQKPSSGQRRRLLALLHQRYKTWTALTRDFVPVGAHSFSELERKGSLCLAPGGNGMQTVAAFADIAARRYYSLVHDLVRRYDRRGLILGDRYQSFYYPAVARASAPYVDVVSSNVNGNWNDGTVARFYLDTLHALTGRPIMVTEFYAAAMENTSHDPNSSSGFVTVATQVARAAAFHRAVEGFARLPFVVGADWFQYYDEPPGGRPDGENYDMGLVDVNDHPYPALLAAVRRFNAATCRRLPPRSTIFTAGIPLAPAEPLAGVNEKDMMLAWDRERGFVPPTTPLPRADMYFCHDADALYVGVYTIDVVEKNAWVDKRVPPQDRMRLSLDVNGVRLELALGPGGPPAWLMGSAVEVRHHAGYEHDVRNVTMLKIPIHGSAVHYRATLVGCGRAWRQSWAGTATLRRETSARLEWSRRD